ncbi:hypothetical protein CBR_g48308 [Chara braunii]|uniref:ABC1 atypical kinase-like domain-containing protein n=1 Tax=Chara braunii TaxID=69332 RepID=A0A388K456_CHABU|nr:hypothetical protein CBR_g48308 [Chara braunii]|eukprot:GBG64840.1 hypothetical protein CBR_g48308 [Chara braunii]
MKRALRLIVTATQLPQRHRLLMAVAGAGGTATVMTAAAVGLLPEKPMQLPADMDVVLAKRTLAASKVWQSGHGIIRATRAACTFASNSLDYKYSLRNLEKGSPEYDKVRSKVHDRAARRILSLCESNRGIYVKAGQFIASVPGMPMEFRTTLSVLQDKAKHLPFSAIDKVFEEEFGKSAMEIFDQFEEEPIAAASLAQVHKAAMADGREVAVKVQYPLLDLQVAMDVQTMTLLSKGVTILFPNFQFEWLVAEFSKNLEKELDFLQEARNAERVAKSLPKKTMTVPKIERDLTTSRILTMEYIHGIKVDDVDSLTRAGIDSATVAETLIEAFADMVFQQGFVHGDPHPGNILVRPLGGVVGGGKERRRGTSPTRFELVLLDHGLYHELNEFFRVNYCRLWKSLIWFDEHELKVASDALGAGEHFKFFPVLFTGRYFSSKSTLGAGLSDDEKAKLRKELKDFSLAYIVSWFEKLPREMVVVLRVEGLIRQVARRLGIVPRRRLVINAKYAAKGILESEIRQRRLLSWASMRATLQFTRLMLVLRTTDFVIRAKEFYLRLLDTVAHCLHHIEMVGKQHVMPIAAAVRF